MASHVYFIRPVGMNGPVKIGVSVMPQLRLQAMGPNSPFRLEVVAVIAGGVDLEQRFHAAFAADRSHNEWFRASERLSSTIAAIACGDFDTSVLPEGRLVRPRKVMPADAVVAAVNNRRLNKMVRSGVPVPAHVAAATRTYGLPAHEVALRRKVVAEFLAQQAAA